MESSGLSIITRIILEIELFTVFNSFAGAVKTYRSFIAIRVSGGGELLFVIVVSPMQQYYLKIHWLDTPRR